tara:strand:- start:503 stop:952 length:450 start_codon:yes stop_codon:yes gene_type:complete
MKKIGTCLTLRGEVGPQVNGYKINLFDGRFDTGYKVEAFQILPPVPTSYTEIFAKLFTSTSSNSISEIQMGNNQEIAWSLWNGPTATRNTQWGLIDEDNLIIEDLYLSNYLPQSEDIKVQYYIKVQKYQLSTWDGALTMVTNLSQGGPQ